MRLGIVLRIALAAAACIALFAVAVGAGGTRIWELAGFDELDKGELRQTAVGSRGEISLGLKATAVDLTEVGLVWSAVSGKGGKVYLGTGYDGKIFRLDAGKAVEIATTGQLVITALVVDKKGDLYASSLPDPVIWKVKNPGAIKAGKPVEADKWAEIVDDRGEKDDQTKHVFALSFDQERRTLFVGTGPQGRLYAIGGDGKATVYLDTDEEHVMCVIPAGKGRLLVGTSPEALLLEVSGPGRSSALADFDATEVKAIARDGKDTVVAVNEFKIPPAIPSKKPSTSAATGSTKKKTSSKLPAAGEGRLFRIRPDGREELIWKDKKAHVTSLGVAAGGRVFAGLGVGGKVISVDRRRDVRTEIDLDERQVLAVLADKSLELAATGDAGSVYRISPARPAEAFYLTPPLDAKSTARFGRLDWFGTGKLKVQARSGNTVVPDDSWTDWSKPLKSGVQIGGDPARYLQLRFSWAGDGSAILRSVELAYRPLNRRAVITELNPDSPFFSAGKGSHKKKSGDKEIEISTRTVPALPEDEHDPELTLTWKVDNPDGDELRYRLWYRAMGQEVWRPILRDDEVLTSTRYKWDTESVPEGRYQVKLRADDSPSNDPGEVLSDEYLSVPVLVDNHQPRVTGLKLVKGKLVGKAVDSFSAIAALEFSVDGGPWMPFFSADGLFDEATEAFALVVPDGLESGPHAIAVRAFDRAGNMGSDEIHVDLK
jgi:hypothetical protein